MLFQLALELLRLHLPYFDASRVGEETSEVLIQLSSFFNRLSADPLPANAPFIPLTPIQCIPEGEPCSEPQRSISVELLLRSARASFGEITNARIKTLRLTCRLRVIHHLSEAFVREAYRTLQPQLSMLPDDLLAVCFAYKVCAVLSSS